MYLPEYDLSDPQTSLRVFGCAPELSSANSGWEHLHYERRSESHFNLPAHRVRKHWLIVKLNPLSEATRTADGRTVREFQHRGCTAYLPDGCSQRGIYPECSGI